MKTKNTFSKLRKTNNNLKDKLNIANRTVCLQIDEIERLNKAIDIKNIVINSLEIKERELSEKIHSLCDKAVEQNRLNNDNYNAWLDEHKLNGKLTTAIILLSFSFVGLAATLIGVMR